MEELALEYWKKWYNDIVTDSYEKYDFMNYSLNAEIKEILNNKNIKFMKAGIKDLDELIHLF